jgi:2-keto-4-pentenoate hydratase/2-oxohepta-3-ene-1,7-dioic acid hydratase in catechol pathway
LRIANLDHRAVLVLDDDHAADLATVSNGRFGPDLAAVYDAWDEFLAWAGTLGATESVRLDRTLLGPPSPSPRQVFAVGLNYRAHAAEAGLDAPTALPPVFTKYVSSFTGPDSVVELPADGNVDWEVELVVVIGREARDVAEPDGWAHVAGLTAGQDLSERVSQLRGPAPQFGLAKSFPGFSPQGPWLVTPDEFADPDDIELGCAIDGEQVQKSRTADLIFPVPRLVAELSRTVTLHPGDVIFTGTPAGVGLGREPRRFLRAGETLRSWVEGVGELNQHFVEATHRK